MLNVILKQNHDASNEIATLSNCGESEILKKNAEFELSRLQTSFLKARERVIKNKNAGQIDDLKAEALTLKNECNHFMHVFDLEIDPQTVAENFAGINREWTATPARAEAAAIEHGISVEQARAMLDASMAAAQMHCLSQRAPILGLYEGWLSDLDPASGIRTDATDKREEQVIQAAYKRAGEWMNRPEGILIEGAAYTLGVILPQWADVLPKATEQTAAIRQRIAKAVDGHAAAKAQGLIEAAREMDKDTW